jgi:hypothetical protein
MNIPHDKFCVLPWISLETSPIGTVRPCCLAEDEIVDDAGDKFNLAQPVLLTYKTAQTCKNYAKNFYKVSNHKPAPMLERRTCWTYQQTHAHPGPTQTHDPRSTEWTERCTPADVSWISNWAISVT